MNQNRHVPPAQEAPPLEAVIFDVDGTLAETELDGHRTAFNLAFIEFGLDWYWSPELYRRLLAVTGGQERIRFFVASYAPKVPQHSDFSAWVASLHQRKSKIYSELVLSGSIPLRPGIARLTDELRAAGIRIAVATTTTPSSLNSLIRANFMCEMSSLFEVIGAGDLDVAKKPAPDVYQWVLRQMRLPPQACLAIEDSWPGLTAARGAGLPVLVTRNSFTADDDFSGAISVVSDLGEPHAPARHIEGLPLAGACVDLAQLRAWHEQSLTTPS